jgi:hypothetical protein
MTTISLSGVERRCRPLDQWPQSDRRQWQSALRAGDLLEQGGCRAKRSPFSNRAMKKGCGRWLAWFDSRGLLDAQMPQEIALLRIGSEPMLTTWKQRMRAGL